MNLKTKGFTLIEIMIVVAIIGLLVAIMIPNFLRMRINTNESLIRGELRTFSTANETYRAAQAVPVYAADIATLHAGQYLDERWVSGGKYGYSFKYVAAANGATYGVEASPVSSGASGINYYCVDQTGVIRKSPTPGISGETGCTGGVSINT